MIKRLFLFVLTVVVNHTPAFVWVLVDFILDISLFWVKRLYSIYRSKDRLKELTKNLDAVQTYQEWKANAQQIDQITNMDLWRQNFISKHYDYILIDDRIKLLRNARASGNPQVIMSLLRLGLIRNFGGITQKRLYTKSYMGTKFKIEEYITEVLTCLSYLNELITLSGLTTEETYSKQLKLDFFHDTRQLFGSTALILHGGSLFGLCHLGVVRALYFKGLLPRVIGGSAVGAAVASLVCTLSDDELTPVLVSITDVMGNIDLLNHDVDERYGNIIENVVKKGYSQDILIFLKYVRDTIGDITFEEAYLKTEKILNIVVHPTHPLVPSLLNYITAPNVIIWTAIYASIGTGVLSDNVKLYVKDFNNNIVPKSDYHVTFLKPQDVSYQQQYFSKKDEPVSNKGLFKDNTTPYTRLTELFNVNHFIISLARPYLAPLLNNDLKHHHTSQGKKASIKWILSDEDDASSDQNVLMKSTSATFFKHLRLAIGLEIQHRLDVMDKLGILPDVVKRFCIDEKPATPKSLTSNRGITIVPQLRYLLKDFGRVFDVHKTMENIPYWVLVGERSVWPVFPLLWSRCAIEFALDDLYNLHRASR